MDPCRWLVEVLFLVIVAALSPLAPAAELQAGAASQDITPPTGFPMWGYAARRDAPCEGILDRLHARAVVLASGEQRLAIVSLDLGRPPTRRSFRTIRQQLQGIGIEHVLLAASHTHHGPVLELDDWPSPEKSYVRQLEQHIVDVVRRAAGRLQPARIGVASKETQLNRNRHSRRPDRPVDRELLVLRIENRKGEPIAHLVNFAAHPTMHEVRVRKFSADYPGAMAALVEKETGAPCLFLQGAAGDLSPNPGPLRGPEAFGKALSMEVLALARTAKPNLGGDLSWQVREREFKFRGRLNLAEPIVRTTLSLSFFKGLIDFYVEEYRQGVRPRLTTVLLGGKIGIVGVSGEPFCGHALSLKQRARLALLLFLGYCNDYHQYFPTIEAVAEGGYGTEPYIASAEIGAGEEMMNRALRDLYEMRGLIVEAR